MRGRGAATVRGGEGVRSERERGRACAAARPAAPHGRGSPARPHAARPRSGPRTVKCHRVQCSSPARRVPVCYVRVCVISEGIQRDIWSGGGIRLAARGYFCVGEASGTLNEEATTVPPPPPRYRIIRWFQWKRSFQDSSSPKHT